MLVLLAIADYANDAGEAWPAIDSLARKARCSWRHVKRLLSQLVASNEVRIVRGGGRGRCNRYTVTLCQSNVSGTNSDKKSVIGRHDDIHDIKRVTSTTIKGDLDVTRSVSTRHVPVIGVQEEGAVPLEGGTSAPTPVTALPARKTRRMSPHTAMQASKLQFAALRSEVEELETAKKNEGADFSTDDRLRLKKARKDLAAVRQRQGEGKF